MIKYLVTASFEKIYESGALAVNFKNQEELIQIIKSTTAKVKFIYMDDQNNTQNYVYCLPG